MKQIAALTTALLLAVPANAEDSRMEDLFKQFGNLSEQAQTLLEGWVEDIGPKLEEMGPALEELAAKLGDMTAYHPPEVLENGDIIIRRKKPVEPEKEADPKQEEPGKIIDL